MESGELAAAVIHEALDSGDFNRLRQFEIRLEKELKPRYKGYKVAENWLSKAWLSDFLALRARKSKFLRDSLAEISTGTADPRMVFSLQGIIRSFFR